MSNGDDESASEGENGGKDQGEGTPSGKHGYESERDGQEGREEQGRLLLYIIIYNSKVELRESGSG